MKRLVIILSLIGLMLSGRVSASEMTITEMLDSLIYSGYRKEASMWMSETMIRMLEEKEGMTFDDYLRKQYYKRIFEEMIK